MNKWYRRLGQFTSYVISRILVRDAVFPRCNNDGKRRKQLDFICLAVTVCVLNDPWAFFSSFILLHRYHFHSSSDIHAKTVGILLQIALIIFGSNVLFWEFLVTH